MTGPRDLSPKTVQYIRTSAKKAQLKLARNLERSDLPPLTFKTLRIDRGRELPAEGCRER